LDCLHLVFNLVKLAGAALLCPMVKKADRGFSAMARAVAKVKQLLKASLIRSLYTKKYGAWAV